MRTQTPRNPTFSRWRLVRSVSRLFHALRPVYSDSWPTSKVQTQHIVPSSFAYISPDRKYALDPPVLATVHDDQNLLTVVPMTDAQKNLRCFVATQFNNTNYCVPDQAATTKRIFTLLAQLIGIQTGH